ncbi:MAG: DUF4340 domain-containing protein [Verrucomicrobiota bacterium]|nr:DUF4340 domain-containing protein [Verrucomicrobiota bacterium]
MNRKQFFLILAVAVIIGGFGLFLHQRNEASYQSGSTTSRKLLGDFPVNDVSHIVLKKDRAEVNLIKKNDLWTVKERKNYPANFDQISEFVRKAQDLKIVQMEAIAPSQRARMELSEPGQGTNTGTLVEFKNAADKPIKTFLLGKTHEKKSERATPFGGEGGFPDGRWILLPNNLQKVFLVSDPLSNAQPNPENWLNKDFFKIEKVKSISLVSTNATNSWKLSRETETNAWKLADLKADQILDTNKVSGLASSLASPSFSDVVVNPKPEETGLDKPTVITLETFDHLTYTIKAGKTNSAENYFMTLNLATNLDKETREKNKTIDDKVKREKFFENWIFLVPKYTLEPLLRERIQLFVEKKEKTDPTAPPVPTAPTALP